MSSTLALWLKAAHWPLSPKRLLSIIRAFSSIEVFMQAGREAWLQAGASVDDIAVFEAEDTKSMEACLAWASEPHHHIITLDDDLYPMLLKETVDPPPLLYVMGDPAALLLPQIAIVGSRGASSYGLDNATQFARALAAAGFGVTSGLARGIDAAAHQGALLASGVTIAVMGSGMKNIYPAPHKTLAATIAASGGAVVTEFSLTMPPLANHFPRRNRIIAGLSMGVLVVEAVLRSGSLITARLALEAGREVFAIPGAIHQPQSRGCHHLIKQGATLVETVEDLLGHLGALTAAVKQALPAPLSLSRQDRLVFKHVDHITTSIDAIILRSGLTASEVSSILLSLALQGYVQPVAGGYVRARASPN